MSIDKPLPPEGRTNWLTGDIAVYDGDKFIPYNAYSTEQVDRIIQENETLKAALAVATAKNQSEE